MDSRNGKLHRKGDNIRRGNMRGDYKREKERLQKQKGKV